MFILFSVFIKCDKFNENPMVIAWDIQEIKKNPKKFANNFPTNGDIVPMSDGWNKNCSHKNIGQSFAYIIHPNFYF